MIARRGDGEIRYKSGVPPEDSELLTVAQAAADAAGAELLARFGQEPVGVSTKSTDTDPVSAADIAAEDAIRALLAERRPGDAILGEEGGLSSGPTGLRWVVDPLDGTVNYLYGIPQWAVSVAVDDGTDTLAGVVFNPVSGERFFATASGGAFLGDVPLRPGAVDRLDRALVATGFGYDADVRAEQGAVAAKLLPRIRDLRRAGAAALDLCAVACGRVDAYYERGVKPWDIAAGVLLCQRVGLAVRELEAGSGFPEGVLVAPPALIDELYGLVG